VSYIHDSSMVNLGSGGISEGMRAFVVIRMAGLCN